MASNQTITQELGQITTPLIDSDIFIISRDNRNTTTTTFANLADSLFAASQYNKPGFTKIAALGQSTIIAGKPEDTLKVVGGQNINVFTTPSTNTLTITSNCLNDPGTSGIVIRTQPFETITRSIVAGDGIEVFNGSGIGGNIEIYNRGIIDVIPQTPRLILTRDGGNLSVNLRETDQNLTNTLVLRNALGDFSARRITADTFIGNLSGISTQSESAVKLTEPFTLTVTGDMDGDVAIDGSEDVTLSIKIKESSVRLGIETSGQYVKDIQVDGTGLSKTITNTGAGQEVLITSNATPNKQPGTIVSRDAFGGFSAGSVDLFGELDLTGNLIVSGNTQLYGNVEILGGSLTTTAGSFDVIPTTARTVNIGGEATTINIGAISGTTHIRHNLEVAGDLLVRGQTTTINTNVTVINDPVITLGSNSIQGDSSDRGIEFEYYDAEGFKQLGFIGYLNGNNTFAFYTEATEIDGNYSGIIGNLIANAKTAEKLTFARTISLAGDVVGSVSFDGLSNVIINTTIQPDSVQLGVDTTGSYVRKAQTQGWGISGAVDQEAGTFVVTSSATNNPIPDTLVYRNSAGDFAANIITANKFEGPAESAERLTTPVTITFEGAAVGTAEFNGKDDFTVTLSPGDNAVELGVNTTGTFVRDIVADEGIEVTRSGEEANIITVRHGNTSDTTSSINSGPTLVQGIGVDKFGHIVSINAVDASLIFLTHEAAQTEYLSKDGGTISGDLTIGGNLTVLGESQATVQVISSNDAGEFFLTFADRSEGYGDLFVDSQTSKLSYNPASSTLSTSKLVADNIRLRGKLLEFIGNLPEDKVGISRIALIDQQTVDNDFFFFGGTASYTEIASGNDGQQPIYVRQYLGDPSLNTEVNAPVRTLTLLDSTGNTSIPGVLIAQSSVLAENVITSNEGIVVNGVNNPEFGQGQIFLNASNGNRIDFRDVGFAEPSFTTRSVGTKIVLRPQLTGSTADYAFGISSNSLWYSTPTLTNSHVWYGGTTKQMELTSRDLIVERDIVSKRDLIVQRNIASNTIDAVEVRATTFTGSLTGNADTATRLRTPRNINGVPFDGTQDITIAVEIDTEVTKDNNSNREFYPTFVSGEGTVDSVIISDLKLSFNPSSGNLTANRFTGNLFGNASTASQIEIAKTITATGDVTGEFLFDGSSNVTYELELSNTGVTPGTYGSETSIPVITVDLDGRVTNASQVVLPDNSYTKDQADQRFVNSSGDTMSGSLVVQSTVSHNGLLPTTGTNIDQVLTFTRTFNTDMNDFIDFGVSGNQIKTGSYYIQLFFDLDYYSGVMSWFDGQTNVDLSDEISLHKAGPGNSDNVYLRVMRRSNNTMMLQISNPSTIQAIRTFVLKVRRIL